MGRFRKKSAEDTFLKMRAGYASAGMRLILVVLGFALLLGGCTSIIATGTKFYVDGELTTDYYYPFDKAWSACNNAVTEMKGVDVTSHRGISKGLIEAVVDTHKVRIYLTYKELNVTTIGVRVGLIGDAASSQFIHDRISDDLPPL